LKRRIRHIVTECERVARGVRAMRASDWPSFGQLMTESGASSANDYEISHPRVEEMVAIANRVPGVVGARMMGGGEGGTALVLLKSSAVPALRSALDAAYYVRFGMAAARSVRVFQFADGAGALPL
jgi:galactokinase